MNAVYRNSNEMKDSTEEWLKDIPATWSLVPCKYLCRVQNGFPFDSSKFNAANGFPLIRIRDITSGKVGTFYNGSYSDEYVVHNNDLLIGMDGDFNVRWWTGNDALLNQRCCRLFPRNDQINLKYIYYFLPYYLKYVNDLTYSTTVKHLSESDICNASILIPEKQEQDIIVAYLDSRTNKIDNIITEAQESIDDYKALKQSTITETVTKGLNKNVPLKDSGYGYIGEIPRDWNIDSLKHISTKTISYGVIKLFDPDENGVKILRCSDVKDGYIDTINIRTITKELSDQYKRTVLHQGDVVINVRGTLGGCAVIPREMEGYNIAREVALISPDPLKFDSRFVMYSLLSGHFTTYQDIYLSGAIYVGINMESLSHYKMAFPSRHEQEKISDYLDAQVHKINEIISEKQSLINDLESYKKSLIYEVVTGKRKVVA